MHIPDGYLSPVFALGTGAITVPIWAIAGRRVQAVLNHRTVPLLAVFSAFAFTIMMFNVPVPGGTTAHGVGGTLIAIVLGPWAAILGISLALILQALFFGDGGILAIFANCLNMGIVLPIAGYLTYRLIAGRASILGTRRVWAAGIGGYVGLTASALLTGIELGVQPILFQDAAGHPLYSPYGLNAAIPAMLIAHALGASIVEGLITGLGLAYLQKSHPEYLAGLRHGAVPDGTATARPFWQLAAGTALVTAALLFVAGLITGGGDVGHLFGADWARVNWADVGTMLLMVGGIAVVLIPLAWIVLPQRVRALGTAFTALAVLAPLGLIAPGFAYGEGGTADVQAAFGYVPSGLQQLSGLFSAPLAGYNLPLPFFDGANAPLWHAALGYEISGILGILLLGALTYALAAGLRHLPARPARADEGHIGWFEHTVAGIAASVEHAVFSEELARQPGWLQRVDPRAKLGMFVVLVLRRGAEHVAVGAGGALRRAARRGAGQPRAVQLLRQARVAGHPLLRGRGHPAVDLPDRGAAAVRPGPRHGAPRAVDPRPVGRGGVRGARGGERVARRAARADDAVGRPVEEPAGAARAAGLHPAVVDDVPVHLPVPARDERVVRGAEEPDGGPDERRGAPGLDHRLDDATVEPLIQDEQRRLCRDDGPRLHGQRAHVPDLPHPRDRLARADRGGGSGGDGAGDREDSGVTSNGRHPEEPVFRLRGVRYLYNGRQAALNGIDLDIYPGEQVVLLGANGSGKSTLLKLLDGIYAPSSGTMQALGQDVAAVAAGHDSFRFHREVGLVFQDPDTQLFSGTVLDDVAFGPLQMGLPPAEVRARCDEALAQMEVTHLAARAPFELSGGEKKRAAIAAVLSLRPQVLLLDEPTASLDPRTKWVLVNLIRKLGEAGKTIITTTHELEIVPIIANRVVVLGEERRVLADGDPQTILRDHPLLIRANLIHEHLHEYGMQHSHGHLIHEHLPPAAPEAGAPLPREAGRAR